MVAIYIDLVKYEFLSWQREFEQGYVGLLDF